MPEVLWFQNYWELFWYGAIGIVLFTGAYTIIGGMKAVIYTETLQTVVLIFGSVIITFLGLQEVGGWSGLRETVTAVSPDHFNMWRPMSDPDFPWTGLLIGGTIVGIWYWCTDQYIVQRTLAAENIKIGRRGAIFWCLLEITTNSYFSSSRNYSICLNYPKS